MSSEKQRKIDLDKDARARAYFQSLFSTGQYAELLFSLTEILKTGKYSVQEGKK